MAAREKAGMADAQNPFDDATFRDISAPSDSSDENAVPAESIPARSFPGNAPPSRISQNGHQHHVGSLTPLQAAVLRKGKVPIQGKRHRLLPLILGGIGAIIIVSCLSIGAVVTTSLLSFQSSLNGPQTTLNDFYSALHTSDYHSAYDQLSSRYQHALDYNTFQTRYAALDSLRGPIENHQITDVQTQGNNATATVKLVRQMQSGSPSNELQTVQLIVENGAWKIDQISPGQSSSG
jgi:hypothetical protein